MLTHSSCTVKKIKGNSEAGLWLCFIVYVQDRKVCGVSCDERQFMGVGGLIHINSSANLFWL
ncbi:hypothetical protein PS922_01259 [Pseudomonas fluorescens]|uniref:Uncharacterized protein n=1 Tax=Pseudomonas fluorescens TaxID=294 RepID=A0A5E7RM97_PSEFL|nr:hypothetical protein PS922_01259 [Pseudomonas fluorescens]